MKLAHCAVVAACSLAMANTAVAGGLERTIQSVAPLFEDGRYLEFSAAYVTPELEGDDGLIPPTFGGPAPITGSTGDLLSNYATFGAAYKSDITDRISYAVIFSQPLGANTEYPEGTSPNPLDTKSIYGGSSATLTSYNLTGLLAYDATPNFTLYGGPALQSIEADAALSFLSDYTVDADRAFGFGFVAGAAYQIPDIALRVALTYRSRIEHNFDTDESSNALGQNQTETDIETPQSLTLDFQTGIAEDTLLFGQIHWVDWSEFEIAPPNYLTLTNGRPLVAYEEDWVTYTLGVGRRFNDTWSGALSLTYEPQTDQELTSLGPVDGRFGVTLGGSYNTERMRVSGGVTYNMLGDAENVLQTDFNGGTALGLGLRIGFKL